MSISDTNKSRKYASIAEVAAAEAKIYADKIILAPDYAAQAQAAANTAVAASETAVGAVNEVSAYAASASESATSAAASAASAGSAAGAAIGRSLRVPDGELIAEFPASSGRSNTVPTFDVSGNVSVKNLADFATLDSSGKLPVSVIPSVALSQLFVVSSQAQMLALDAQVGDIAKRTDLGYSFCLAAEPASTLSNWVQLTDDVLSILADKTGATAIGAEDDAGAPTTVQDLLNAKVNIADLSSSSGSTLVGMDRGGNLKDVVTWVTPEQFGAVSYPRYTMFGSDNNSAADIAAAVAAGTVVDSTAAIQQAINTGFPVVLDKFYYTSAPLIQNETNSAWLIGGGPQESGICKYTSTTGSEFNVDAVLVCGQGGVYMRYKGISGLALVRAKLITNDASLQKPKAIENFFNYLDVNLIPQGYGLYVRKGDHYVADNVILHGNETNFYSTDLWMSRLLNVWASGGTGYVIETGTSITMTAVWSLQTSWTTYDTLGSVIKRHYAYDIGGFYHNLESCACDFAGADGRPSESIWKFRQGSIGINMSSIGSEKCHARYLIDTTAGGSAASATFININSISVDQFYNKYADSSLAEKFRSLIVARDYCNLTIESGKILSVYSTGATKPHIAYVGKKARLIMGSLYFLGDVIQGVQLNEVSYFTSTNFTTGVISPVAKTASEVWVDSDTFQASVFSIRNGILDINVTSSGSDLFWNAGNSPTTGAMMYRYGGYCGRGAGNENVQFRAQNGNRAVSLVVDTTSGGLYDYNVNQWILRQEQGTGGSSFTLGSKLSAQDVVYNFQTAGDGASFNSRLLARTTTGVHSIYAQGAQLSPFNDNSMSSGGPSNRWSTVYAGTGSINTSDINYKFDVELLNETEIRVARKCAELYRTFKFKDGDSGRTHIGTIAQWVLKAFEDEGLDAEEYGIYCYDEWSEEAEVLEDDGSVRIPHKDAGSRHGIRYDEFNSFVNAGMNAWLKGIEDRLSLLEKQ